MRAIVISYKLIADPQLAAVIAVREEGILTRRINLYIAAEFVAKVLGQPAWVSIYRKGIGRALRSRRLAVHPVDIVTCKAAPEVAVVELTGWVRNVVGLTRTGATGVRWRCIVTSQCPIGADRLPVGQADADRMGTAEVGCPAEATVLKITRQAKSLRHIRALTVRSDAGYELVVNKDLQAQRLATVAVQRPAPEVVAVTLVE
jgi:hypothetical protein